MALATVSDVQLVELPRHERSDGELVVVEQGKSIAYPAVRTFSVTARKGAVRGRHAHRRCSQFFVCVHGAIEVECDDGTSSRKVTLDDTSKGLLVPPTIWATETYLTEGSVLLVLCDRPYEQDDYVREYEEFVAWRRSHG